MKNLMNKIRKANKGFTLVELIIVIAIIAVLSAVAAPQYIKWVDKSKIATDNDNAQILLTAVQTAVADPDYTIGNSTSAAVFSSSGITPAADASGTGLAKYFAELGIDTTNTKVTYTKDATRDTFTVTVAGNTVTGAWG